MYFRTDDDVRACDDVRTELMPFIQSQYAASVKMVSILQSCKDHILPEADIDLFFSCMFNIKTAIGYGLDVWGTIIGVARTIPQVEIVNGKPVETGVIYTLDDDNYRKILRCKAHANIMDSTLFSMNYVLKQLFPDYRCFIRLESTPMEISYIFLDTNLSPLDLSIFALFADFNRGAGVGWNLFNIVQDNVFGFLGSNLQPFDQGYFYMSIGG